MNYECERHTFDWHAFCMTNIHGPTLQNRRGKCKFCESGLGCPTKKAAYSYSRVGHDNNFGVVCLTESLIEIEFVVHEHGPHGIVLEAQ